MSSPPPVPPVREPAALWRRLAAMVYDGIAVLALLYFAALFPTAAHHGAIAPGNPWHQLYLLAIAYAYFAVCWRRGGQTVGMRPWKVRVVSLAGSRVTWRQTFVRFLVALLPVASFAAAGQWSLRAGLVAGAAGGLGYAWSLWDPRQRAWHDIASRTALVKEAGTA